MESETANGDVHSTRQGIGPDSPNEKMQSGDRTYTLDVPPKIYKQRLYVPVRFVAEWFDGEAKWDAQTRTVLIKDKSPYITSIWRWRKSRATSYISRAHRSKTGKR
ncbi:hypothetical protein PACILC2_23060 [Paenibacillus cisolokensis]|uniref:Copper amine oxidase-like N-terminal domain-containing protein n=1 Tax=Paenibacillus cisolokensis TaxID=1658519 RepID=A0ABN2VU32_9BACL|nr:hypothetical protein PACILC2_23060 [Paenibacillus cisolokensis]